MKTIIIALLAACANVESTSYTLQFDCVGQTYCNEVPTEYRERVCADSEMEAAQPFEASLEAMRGDSCTLFWVGEYHCIELSDPCKED